MRINFRGNKKRKEEQRRKKQEEKRNQRLQKRLRAREGAEAPVAESVNPQSGEVVGESPVA